jgi:hypothetical protein
MKPNSIRSDELDKSFFSQTDNTNSQDEILSIAAVEDKLVMVISSYNTGEIDEEGIHITWQYLDQAKALIYRINVYDPLPEFVIFIEDIPKELSLELARLGKATMKKVITKAVRRIYESVDAEYFHTNGIYSKIRWRFAS